MRLHGTLAGILLGITACDRSITPPQPQEPPSPPPPATAQYFLSAEAGDGQTATVGTNVSIAPAVRVTTAEGVPVVAWQVDFAVVEGSGSLAGGATRTVLTDQYGIARSQWTLGIGAGTNRLRITAKQVANSIEYTGFGTPGPLAQIVPAMTSFPVPCRRACSSTCAPIMRFANQ